LILHALQSKAETTDLVQSKLKQTTHVKTRMLLYLFRPKKTTHVKLLTIIYFSHSGFKVLLQCTWHFCLYYLWPSNLISTAIYIYRTLRRQLQQILLSKCEPCLCQDTLNIFVPLQLHTGLSVKVLTSVADIFAIVKHRYLRTLDLFAPFQNLLAYSTTRVISF
jgi:hypothetical protein